MSSGETHAYSVLSERELQIVELVASGLTNQDIANTLEISKRTVDNHISNILQKTGTGNRVALFRWALNWGKICIDEVNCCKLPEPGEAPKPVYGNGNYDNGSHNNGGHDTGHSNVNYIHGSQGADQSLNARGINKHSQAS